MGISGVGRGVVGGCVGMSGVGAGGAFWSCRPCTANDDGTILLSPSFIVEAVSSLAKERRLRLFLAVGVGVGALRPNAVFLPTSRLQFW
jgi:hypothetical protein